MGRETGGGEMLIWTTETAGYRFYERVCVREVRISFPFQSLMFAACAAVVGILHLILPE